MQQPQKFLRHKHYSYFHILDKKFEKEYRVRFGSMNKNLEFISVHIVQVRDLIVISRKALIIFLIFTSSCGPPSNKRIRKKSETKNGHTKYQEVIK